MFSIIIDYYAALWISKLGLNDPKRKLILTLSLTTNLGFLGYFKYTNFFLGMINDINFVNQHYFTEYYIILPVGISFYTFQSISYTIDVYKNRMEAKNSFIEFALYVSFFPQLVAGPIVRAETFFRDLYNRLPVTYDIIKYSALLILVGFTKKTVFADNLAVIVDSVFKNHDSLNAIEIWTGVFAFMWQIYLDFSGYTDIAIGVARLFGFQFDKNFYFPFNVTSISEHWSRWHISFTSWIRDYIFIPLGGSRGSKFLLHRNIFITFLFGGLWHGAAYHYLAWGIWHTILLSGENEYSKSKLSLWFNENGGVAYKFFCYLFTMICLGAGLPLFRAETLTDAFAMLKTMFLISDKAISNSFFNFAYFKLLILIFVSAFIFEKYKLKNMIEKTSAVVVILLIQFFLLLCFSAPNAESFIYFAF